MTPGIPLSLSLSVSVSTQDGTRNGTGTPGDAADPRQRSETGLDRVVAFVAGPAVNGLLYVAPAWMTITDLAVAGAFIGGAATLSVLELHWSRFGLRSLRRS